MLVNGRTLVPLPDMAIQYFNLGFGVFDKAVRSVMAISMIHGLVEDSIKGIASDQGECNDSQGFLF